MVNKNIHKMPASKDIKRDILSNLIDKKLTCKELMDELKISKSTLYKYLSKYNLEIYKKELYFDNTVFDIIDTEEKAYWLGFLYADGFINGKHNNSVELSLSGKDKDHLEKFNKFLKNTKPIKESFITRKDKKFIRCRCLVTDKHFHDRLIDLGCVPNKSLTLNFPKDDIFKDKKLKYHFIRGYMDGDGSLYKTKSNRLVIEFLGTKEFLTELVSLFSPIFKSLHDTRSSKSGKNNFGISCSGNNADKLGKLLYKDATIYLNRKYKIFAQLCKS